MNPLKILLTILCACSCSTLSAAIVHFKFEHVASAEDAGFSSYVLPTFYVQVSKQHGSHEAGTIDNLAPGTSAENFIRSSFLFAPDVTGTYDVTVGCQWGMEGQSYHTQLQILPEYNNKTILIQGSCPMQSFKNYKDKVPEPSHFTITLLGDTPLPLSVEPLSPVAPSTEGYGGYG